MIANTNSLAYHLGRQGGAGGGVDPCPPRQHASAITARISARTATAGRTALAECVPLVAECGTEPLGQRPPWVWPLHGVGARGLSSVRRRRRRGCVPRHMVALGLTLGYRGTAPLRPPSRTTRTITLTSIQSHSPGWRRRCTGFGVFGRGPGMRPLSRRALSWLSLLEPQQAWAAPLPSEFTSPSPDNGRPDTGVPLSEANV